MGSTTSRSPLKAKPLRLPGQSVQEDIDDLLWDETGPYIAFAVAIALVAFFEWMAVLLRLPRQPWIYSGVALVAIALASVRCLRVHGRLKQLKLGRDGERAVGQYLERLRTDGADVFHDVPGDGFNIDHVVLSAHGFYAVETKAWNKSKRGEARITLSDDGVLLKNRLRPDRDPVVQAQAGAKWLSQLLEETTGKQFRVRGVVLFPGWFVEPMTSTWRMSPHKPWLLEPKALPAFIGNEPKRITDSDLRLAAYHLSRYVRATAAG
jgi:Nuclease-related domain